MADARTLAACVLAVALAAQAALAARTPRTWDPDHAIGPPPPALATRIASLDEPRGAAYALALVLQSFDAQAGQQQRIAALDRADVLAWLARIGEIAPDSGYDTFLATRVYAETLSDDDLRALLVQVRARFEQAPDASWTSIAHAVWLAGHRLGDRPLAADLAGSLRRHAGPGVPDWARQMEALLRADLGELEAARRLIGALLDAGTVTDERERRVLIARLREAERRATTDERPEAGGEAGR